MRRQLGWAALAALGSACASGSAGGLGYGVPTPSTVTYVYGDTTSVTASLMGQSMEIALAGEARYGARFAPSGDGVRVTLSVEDLAGTLTVPMAGSQDFDESAVSGDLTFTLSRRGDATVTGTPTVSPVASRVVSSLGTAHTFFPALPDRVVTTGDSWVDTIAYEGDAELGDTRETTILTYRVVGDTVVAGRALVHIVVVGTSELSNATDMGGTPIRQTYTLDVTGTVLWDAAAGMLFESVRRGRGTGTARVPLVPQPIPIEVQSLQRTRLAG